MMQFKWDGAVMLDKWVAGSRTLVLAGLGVFVVPALAQLDNAAQTPPAPSVPSAAKVAAAPSPARKSSPYRPEKLTRSAKDYYAATQGVDKLKVSHTASGNLIRFSYRVTDPERAKVLSDKKATPYLIGHRSRAVLQVPVMDKVGQLRQAQTPQAGQEYWMVFSNKGDVVKPGERVSVVIGTFRVDGLRVE
jgi:hypothetical protein